MADIEGASASLLDARQKYAQERIIQLARGLDSLESLRQVPNLCIYVTGSFGRLEASEYSDVDLFFVQTTDEGSAPIGRLDKTLVDADIIKLTRNLDFPEFSRDGEFLQVHQLNEILMHLGGQQDDVRNYFTARLLLLLESRSLYAPATYNNVLEQLVQAYYRDYQDHEKDFRPVFLVNDIIRFWKTLCLNYEHRRNRPDGDELSRAKSHLKNLKLKFSRMLTCYSALAWIAGQDFGPGPDDVLEMVSLTPVQRLQALKNTDSESGIYVASALGQYAWFLEAVGKHEEDALAWIKEGENRDLAFDRARKFGEDVFELILHLSSNKPFLRYLVV